METLFWETHNNSLFNVFIRDLSMSLNTNLKHMILDNDKVSDKISDKTTKSKKPKQIKKKDLIIQEQNKKRFEKLIQDDLMKIDYAFKNINEKNFMEKFNYLKTHEAKQVFRIFHSITKREKKRLYVSNINIIL